MERSDRVEIGAKRPIASEQYERSEYVSERTIESERSERYNASRYAL
jgi:hypothetical protein